MSDETFQDKGTRPRAQYHTFQRGNLSRYAWVSKRAPGTPPGWEAVFEMIERSQTETPSFRAALRHYGVSEELLWEMYGAWKEGRVHEEINRRRQG